MWSYVCVPRLGFPLVTTTRESPLYIDLNMIMLQQPYNVRKSLMLIPLMDEILHHLGALNYCTS